MKLYFTLLFCVASVFAREEVHHIHAQSGRNVHIHLHEVGDCSEEAHHYHHHGADEGEGGKDIAHDDEHSAHHNGDGSIHLHIHEAGENCTMHGGHGDHDGSHEGGHGDCHGRHHGDPHGRHHGDPHGRHHGDHHGGRGSHACAMCARELAGPGDDRAHHPRDHPGHHGPHSHGDDSPQHAHSEDYAYAHCDMVPDSSLPKKKRLKIKGTVHMRQLIYGGPMEMTVELSGFKPHKDETNQLHGLHVHEFGDLSNGCQNTGSHFNPFGVDHGAPTDDIRHPGDYGNIESDRKGVVSMQMNNSKSSLIDRHNIIGRSMVIHENADDLGRGGTAGSKRSGNAGPYLACCVIARSKPHDQWAESFKHSEHTLKAEADSKKAGKRNKKGRKHHMKHKDHGDHGDHSDHYDHGDHSDHHGHRDHDHQMS